MTPKEAVRAMDERAHIKATIPLYGTFQYKRIMNVRINSDKYGRRYYTVELLDTNGTLVCGPEDIDLADDTPDIIRERVYPKVKMPKHTSVITEPPKEAMILIGHVQATLDRFSNGEKITTEDLLTAKEKLSQASSILKEAISVPTVTTRAGFTHDKEVE